MRRSPIMPTVLSTPEPGAGSVSVRSAAGIKKAQQAGIVVVRASRTGSGRRTAG
ncbi:L-asparaginase, type II [Klebsiella pneumoniae]|uniref:L-asparaginase, type II n=1 Tax=Klebsiella pneumoniae TaxID=573 RepID=A0A377TQ52_KLEPN|nr:L-asparaginase, type II [Klebsiella pneumoniae]